MRAWPVLMGVLLLMTMACGGSAKSPPPAAPPPASQPSAETTERPAPAKTPAAAIPDTALALPQAPRATAPDTVALPWRPPDTGPSLEAQRVLNTLPEPAALGLPPGLPKGTVTTAPPAGPRPASGTCYEVQLLGASQESAARDAARRAEAALGVPAHVVFENGLHKVRAGGCLSRAEAEALRDRARVTGYSEAFLAETAPK